MRCSKKIFLNQTTRPAGQRHVTCQQFVTSFEHGRRRPDGRPHRSLHTARRRVSVSRAAVRPRDTRVHSSSSSTARDGRHSIHITRRHGMPRLSRAPCAADRSVATAAAATPLGRSHPALGAPPRRTPVRRLPRPPPQSPPPASKTRATARAHAPMTSAPCRAMLHPAALRNLARRSQACACASGAAAAGSQRPPAARWPPAPATQSLLVMWHRRRDSAAGLARQSCCCRPLRMAPPPRAARTEH